jgi:hypothetical protein
VLRAVCKSIPLFSEITLVLSYLQDFTINPRTTAITHVRVYIGNRTVSLDDQEELERAFHGNARLRYEDWFYAV